MNILNAEETNDEYESGDAEGMEGEQIEIDSEDEYSLLGSGVSRAKKPKGKTKTESGFYFKFFIALITL